MPTAVRGTAGILGNMIAAFPLLTASKLLISPQPIGQASGLAITPATLLWLAASVIAALLLFGSMNRRRAGLTGALREFVSRNQPPADDAPPEPDQDSASD